MGQRALRIYDNVLIFKITVVLVGWDINVLFQHKNWLYWWQGLGWRFSSARL